MIRQVVALLALTAQDAPTADERGLDFAVAERMATSALARHVLGVAGERVVEARIVDVQPYVGYKTILFANRARSANTPPLCVAEVVTVNFSRSLRSPPGTLFQHVGLTVGRVFKIAEGEPLIDLWSDARFAAFNRRCAADTWILGGDGRRGFFNVHWGFKRSDDPALALLAGRTMMLARARLDAPGYVTCTDQRSRPGDVCPDIADRLRRSLPGEMPALSVQPCRSAADKICVSGAFRLISPTFGVVEVEVTTNAAPFAEDHVPGAAEPVGVSVTIHTPSVV